MTKKKPDFLRDLDTAIMDELTGGGIKENAAGLVGTGRRGGAVAAGRYCRAAGAVSEPPV